MFMAPSPPLVNSVHATPCACVCDARQLGWARPAVRLRDGSTAQAVLCLRLSRTKKRKRGQKNEHPWHLMCLPHRKLDLRASSSSRAAAAAAARSGARAYAVPATPDQPTLQQWAEHATNLGCYPLREVATADKAVLVPLGQVVARVTVVPVLRQHQHVAQLREARTRPLVFVVDELH